MAVARKILCNPADKTKRYILWSNGYIEPVGGALPVTQGEGSFDTWTPSAGAPVNYGNEPYVSFQIYNWATPSGWTLDMWGNVWRWGGAPAIPGAPGTGPLTGGPEYLFGTNGGFSSPTYGNVIDFKMDPTGGGTGYILLYNGEVIGLGTGVTAVQRVAAIPETASRQLILDWTSKRYWILDNFGRVSAYNGATPHPAVVDVNAASATYPAYIWGRGGQYCQGGFKLYNSGAAATGWEVDAFGRVYKIGSAQDAPGFQFTPNAKHWVDLEIVDDGTASNPLRLVCLTAQGTQFEYVVSTAPAAQVSEPTGTLTTSNKPWVGWSYFDREGDGQVSWQAKVITSAVYTVGTTNEVQSTNQTGGPTGGSVILGFQRTATSPVATTAPIPSNSTAGTIQTALNALPNIGASGVVCAGGPWGTAPVTVTFSGTAMAGWNWPQLTLVSNAFTGGASPTVALSTTTPGVGIDPNVATNVWSGSNGSAAVPDTSTRQRVSNELANSTTFRAYVRVVDTSVKTAEWDYSQFATAYTALNVPSIVVSDLSGLAGLNITATAATGGGLPGTARFAIQYQDAGSSTWLNVRNGDALVPAAGVASVVDKEAPFGVARTYRAVTYVYDSSADTWQQSAWSSSVAGTLSPKSVWVLSSPTDSTPGLVIRQQPGFQPTRPVVSSVVMPVNRYDPVVLSDGKPKLPAFDLRMWALTSAERAKIEALVDTGLVLQVRDPLGRSFYGKLMGQMGIETMRAGPLPTETTSIRDAHEIQIAFQAIERPKAGPTTGPLVEA